jgi:HK97 family phage major capsid protein
MTMTRNEFNGLLRPDDVREMLFDPLEQLSIATIATTVVYTDSHTFRIPVMTADPLAEWVAEGEEINISDPKIEEASTEPKKVAGLTTVTRELLQDSTGDTAARVGNGLARDISRKLDAAFFADTAPTNGPAGVGTITATEVDAPADWTDADPFTDAVYTAEDNSASITGWFAHPDDAKALATVKESSGSSRNLLAPDPTQAGQRLIEGVPLHVSKLVTPGEVWGIDATQAFTVIRQDAEIVADSSAFFTSDRTALRATMRAGFLFINPAGIIKITRAA